jgi:cellulose synthase/poly-beta-1,6-N-acetylglucosamine synthase-like glycosyltransferase
LVGSYLKGWLKTTEKHVDTRVLSNVKISILVTGRNEEQNIEKCLQSLVNQSFPKENYEIIFLNDFSEDNSLAFATDFKSVVSYNLEDFLPEEFRQKANKKRAITLGVEKAKYDVIITCDADCFYGENWLASFASKYQKHHCKLITAPVVFNKENGMFSKFLELDLISLMGITGGSIKNQEPNMVNGANMLFEKQAFIEVKGFEGNENVPSGDDVFLLQKIHNRYKGGIAFLKNIEATAYTNAPSSFKEFVNQRIRWSSKSVTHADKKVKFDLSLNYFFYLFTTLNLFIFSFHDSYYLKMGIVMFLLKIIIDAIFFKNLLVFFKRMDMFKYLIVIELMHLMYVSLLGIFSLYGKYTWKGRKV